MSGTSINLCWLNEWRWGLCHICIYHGICLLWTQPLYRIILHWPKSSFGFFFFFFILCYGKSWTILVTNPINRINTALTTPWRRKWQPTPVFLPGESQGRGSLVGCCLWGRKESDMTEQLHFLTFLCRNNSWKTCCWNNHFHDMTQKSLLEKLGKQTIFLEIWIKSII